MRKVSKSPALAMPYAQFAQQSIAAESMVLDIRKKLIEDYRALGYTVTEIDDSIIMEKKDGSS